MRFRDRTEGAALLLEKLERFRRDHPLILGIPRGAMPMARILANGLNCDLDVVLVHKVGAPDNPEFAIAAVSEFGPVYRSQGMDYYDIPKAQFEPMVERERERLKQRRKMYSPIRPPLDPAGRTVIIVDDGIATGATMMAAVRAIREQDPARIVVAAPTASTDAVALLEPEADELVILDVPEYFFAISQFYDYFPQVTDEEVSRILSEESAPGKAA